MAIAIDNEADYEAASCAGVDAALPDSPRKMAPLRDACDCR
ncbi:MAG TPA: hypothetical protein VJS18_11740 [Paraburkholderia sp.]|nr:hypothetical protein [Paraburkholderia sp.]